MPSPFTGMDPWLEGPGVFPDLHDRFITHLSEALNALLPAPYFAAIANRVWVEMTERRVEPDVNVLKPPGSIGRPTVDDAEGEAAIALLPELGLLTIAADGLPDEPMEEAYLEIHAAPGGEHLVTAVEVLSLSNKAVGSDGRAAYRQKQHEMRESGVNLVEIDLLRGGRHTTLVPEAGLRQAAGVFDYHACITLAARPREFRVARVRLADQLPRLPIPLLSDAPPVVIDLQPVLERCYDSGLYARRVHYDRPCEPPLTPEQQSWAEGILRAKGLLK
jgi:Protein of unknown function (DUF4058)